VLKAFLNAFRLPDLRNKILFTLFIIAIYRFGSYVPVPVVDFTAIRNALEQGEGGFLQLINLFSGGALGQMAVFGLGIMPYITSSIIMQLLTVVIPKLQALQDQGELGVKKINQYTRYVTVVLAILQSTGIVFLFHSGQTGLPDPFSATNFTPPNIALIVLTLTAGTALIMWLGELITQRGVGNGMSILIFTSVIASLPGQGNAILRQGGVFKFSVIMLIGLGIIVAVVFMDQGQRRIPIQYAKRIVGRKMTTGGSTYLPLKVNQAGVIPIIFATSVMYMPVLLASIVPWDGFRRFVEQYLSANNPTYVYMVVLAAMIVFFAYFYTAIQFDPVKQADNLRKQGGFIPGIRPGGPTATYLNDILVRITLPGALFLAAIALVPTVVFKLWDFQQFPFGGTSVLIAVGVALETMKQIESQLLMRHYEGFLK
jgi:preprotein translocase subunit SecY